MISKVFYRKWQQQEPFWQKEAFPFLEHYSTIIAEHPIAAKFKPKVCFGSALRGRSVSVFVDSFEKETFFSDHFGQLFFTLIRFLSTISLDRDRFQHNRYYTRANLDAPSEKAKMILKCVVALMLNPHQGELSIMKCLLPESNAIK